MKAMKEYNLKHPYACAYYNDRNLIGILSHFKMSGIKNFLGQFCLNQYIWFLGVLA